MTTARLLISIYFCLELIKNWQVCNCEDCSAAYECTGGWIDSSDIECDGYYSCSDSEQVLSSTRTRCSGGSSCSNSQFVFTLEYLDCRGGASCTNINRISSYEEIYCIAFHSCANSVLHAPNSSVYCDGEYGCDSSVIIYGIEEVIARSAFGLTNAIINYKNKTGIGSQYTSIQNITVKLYGYLAGYNTTIYCNQGDRCEIECFGNGCVGTVLICSNEAVLCQVDCLNSTSSDCATIINVNTSSWDIMANETVLLSLSDIEVDYDLLLLYPNIQNYDLNLTNSNGNGIGSVEFYERMNDRCRNVNRSNTKSCQDSNDCAHTSIDRSNKNGENLLCCTGEDGCQESRIYLNSINNYNHQTVCIGYESCEYTQWIYLDSDELSSNDIDSINSSIGVKKKGEIYCYGYVSCYNMTTENDNYINLVECSGEASCEGSIIKSVNKVICSGYESCGYSNIINTPLIYLTGSDAGYNAIITMEQNYEYSNEMTVYLMAMWAGWNTEIICETRKTCNIICHVYGACIRTTVICGGKCNIICQFNDSSTCPSVTIIPYPTTTAIATPNTTSLNTTAPKSVQTNNTAETSNNINDARLRALSETNTYTLGCIFLLFIVIVISGYFDAKSFRPNELFRWTSIVFCATYAMDFISGLSNDRINIDCQY